MLFLLIYAILIVGLCQAYVVNNNPQLITPFYIHQEDIYMNTDYFMLNRKKYKNILNVELKFQRYHSPTRFDGGLAVLIADHNVAQHLGYQIHDKNYFCCTDELYKENICPEKNHLILNNITQESYYDLNYIDIDDRSPFSMNSYIKHTGLYSIVIATCESTPPNMEVQVKYTVYNHYGHLPSTLYPQLYFDIAVFSFFFIFIIFWCVLCYRRYECIIPSLHYSILFINLGYFVVYLLHFVYLYLYNNSGISPLPILYTLLGVQIITKIFLKIICLGCSMGMYYHTKQFNWRHSILLLFFCLYSIIYMTIDIPTSIIKQQNALIYIPPSTIYVDFFLIICSFILQKKSTNFLKEQIDQYFYHTQKKFILYLYIFSFFYLCCFLSNQIILNYMDISVFYNYLWFLNDNIWDVFDVLFLLIIVIIWYPVTSYYEDYDSDSEIIKDINDLTIVI
ncbi:hypothetical protein WA158_007321 [Blastocystis sp. Blastoise]